MLRRELAAGVLALGIWGFFSSGTAEGAQPEDGAGKSVLDQLGDFGRNILDTILPTDHKQRQHRPDDRSATRKFYSQGAPERSTPPRAGSGTPRSVTPAAETSPARRAVPRSAGGNVHTPGSRPATPIGRPDPRPLGAATAQVRPRGRSQAHRGPAGDHPPIGRPGSTAAGLSDLSDPVLRPLHERLEGFRRSVFQPGAAGGPSPPSEPDSTADHRAGSDLPTVRQPDGLTIKRPASVDSPSGPAQRPLIAQRTVPETYSESAAAPGDQPPVGPAPLEQPPSTSPPTLTTTVDPLAAGQRGVLFARNGPILSVQTVGPRRISVGKESAYEVFVQNSGEAAAEELVVSVDLPEWADVVGAEAKTGAILPATPVETVGPLQWRVGRLEPNTREKLVLRIVPRESRPFELAVRWDYKPAASQATIEVQEAKLVLTLEGPREVLYGKKETYRLKVANTGNGDAGNVVIRLLPIAGTASQPVSHNVGRLAAGTQKAVEVELTARQVGNLMIRVEAQGDGGVYAELAEKVDVLRAVLQLDVDGPSVQYVGAVAGYRVRVRNPGTAPAPNVKLSVNIPPGAKALSDIPGSRLEANATKVQWTIDALNPGSEQSFLLKFALGLPGSAQIQAVATADGDLTAAAATTTQVEAIADLVLAVKDPTGPVRVGEEAVYEVQIRNRGTKNAQDVEVVAYFSNGIEPTKAEGGQHKIEPGQVVFSPIPIVAAGEQIVLKVHARAETAGNHVFRAEVRCKPLGTRLVSEETTYFYHDQSVSRPAPDVSSPQQGTPMATAGALRRAY